MVKYGSYLVPDFYKEFACKCGDCRISCCEGWDITISQKEYYEILSLDTSEELGSRIMRAFYIPKDATPEHFAVLNHDWLGRCPLRGDDGLCMLQVEKGEDSIPQLCRRYPRSIRSDLSEATMSNSCERMIEMLLNRTTPLRYVMTDLPCESDGHEAPDRFALRMQCIGILQDRRSSVKESLLSIGELICGKQPSSRSFEDCLSALLTFCDLYAEISPSISDYCRYAEETLTGISGEGYKDRYRSLMNMAPDMNLTLENLLINHMFYEKFPYSETRENEEEEFVSMCGLIGFIDLLITGNSDRISCQDDMVDLLSHAFRMIEHTSFHYNAHVLLSHAGFDDPSDAMCLVFL